MNRVFETISWLFHRLGKMSFSEIVYRLKKSIQVLAIKLNVNDKATVEYVAKNSFLSKESANRYLVFASSIPLDISQREKKLALDGKFLCFGELWSFDENIDWNYCQITDTYWESVFYTDINFRSGSQSKDIRAVWEPARLQCLVTLAKIGSLDDGVLNEALEKSKEIIDSWYSQYVPYKGPHSISVMESALRVVSLCFSYSIFSKQYDDTTNLNISRIIVNHALMIQERLSLYSSTGNHTIAEAVGLLFAGHFCSKHKNALKWRKRGEELLVKEYLSQTYIDGGGKEHASWYLGFILQLTKLATPLLNSSNALKLETRLRESEGYVNTLGQNFISSLGDSDGGFALCPHYSLFHKGEREVKTELFLKSSGLGVLEQSDTRLMIDFGGLGLKPSYGHGHADSLSVLIEVKQVPVFVDCGTYSYNRDKTLRNLFRSTMLHNTVCVNDVSQAKMLGSFLWDNDIQTNYVKSLSISGHPLHIFRHEGYFKAHNVNHFRGLLLRSDGSVVILDFLSGTPDKAYQHWNLGLNVVANKTRNLVELTVKGPANEKLLVEAYNKELRSLPIELLEQVRRSPSYLTIQDASALRVAFDNTNVGLLCIDYANREVKNKYSELTNIVDAFTEFTGEG